MCQLMDGVVLSEAATDSAYRACVLSNIQISLDMQVQGSTSSLIGGVYDHRPLWHRTRADRFICQCKTHTQDILLESTT